MLNNKTIATSLTPHNLLAIQTLDRFLGAASLCIINNPDYFKNSPDTGNIDQKIEQVQDYLVLLKTMPLDTSLANLVIEHKKTLVKILVTLAMNKDDAFAYQLISEIADERNLNLSDQQLAFLSLCFSIMNERIFSDVTALNSLLHMFQLLDEKTEINKQDLFSLSVLYQKLAMIMSKLENEGGKTLIEFRQVINLALNNLGKKIQQLVSKIDNVSADYLSDMMRNEEVLIWDKYFNIETKETEAVCKNMGVPFFRENNPYEGIDYRDIAKIIRFTNFSPNDVVVDYGCGKGRFLSVIGSLAPARKVIGLDFEKSYVEQTQNNLINNPHFKSDFSAYQMNAIDFVPDEGNVFFFFNPFKGYTFTKVIKKIKESLDRNPRPIKIIYVCPIHRVMLDAQKWLLIQADIDEGRILLWTNQ